MSNSRRALGGEKAARGYKSARRCHSLFGAFVYGLRSQKQHKAYTHRWTGLKASEEICPKMFEQIGSNCDKLIACMKIKHVMAHY